MRIGTRESVVYIIVVSDTTGAPHPQLTRLQPDDLLQCRRSENQDNFLFFRRGLSFLLFFVSPRRLLLVLFPRLSIRSRPGGRYIPIYIIS